MIPTPRDAKGRYRALTEDEIAAAAKTSWRSAALYYLAALALIADVVAVAIFFAQH